MLRDKRFWIGFLLGYALLAFMPQLNVLTKLKGKGGS
jgi:hypothetical protein